MPVKLLHILSSSGGHGEIGQAALLRGMLPRDEFEQQVVLLDDRGEREVDSLRKDSGVTIIKKRRGLDLAAYQRLKRIVRSAAPDIVHTWQFAASAYGRRAAAAATRARIVTTQLTIEPQRPWSRSAVDRWLARRTDRLVVPSPIVRDFYARQRIGAERFAIIPRAVAPSSPVGAAESQRAGDDLRQSLGIPRAAKLIVAGGHFERESNFKQLMWAMAILNEVRSDFHLLIFGDGPQHWRLVRYCRQIQIDGHVTLLDHPWKLQDVLPHASCFASAGESDVQPDAMLAAMAAGLPVVACDTPGHRELIVPEHSGYLTPPGDRAALARWIAVLFDDPQLARRLGAAGCEKAAQDFGADRMTTAYGEIYRQLAKR